MLFHVEDQLFIHQNKLNRESCKDRDTKFPVKMTFIKRVPIVLWGRLVARWWTELQATREHFPLGCTLEFPPRVRSLSYLNRCTGLPFQQPINSSLTRQQFLFLTEPWQVAFVDNSVLRSLCLDRNSQICCSQSLMGISEEVRRNYKCVHLYPHGIK